MIDMKTSSLDYDFPKELIAKEPVQPRDAAKLMRVDKKTGRLSHLHFYDLEKILKPGDVLVFNQSKVFPARIFAQTSNDKKIEIVFLSEIKPGKWEVMVGGRIKDGEVLKFPAGLEGAIRKGKVITLNLPKKKKELYKYLEKHGQMPLPPYIKRKATKRDNFDYQNVFANEVGSAAAPTAGLHFTESLIEKLKNYGVQIEYITLHVGLGTFAPIRTEEIREHKIHSEYFEIDSKTADRLNLAKTEKRRIIACGTTSVRVLEAASENGMLEPQKKETSIYIYPGYKFKFVDGLITNFHTPRSSLLALVYAFSGESLMRKAYQEAIKKKYRLFSYGDGMIIL
jgi:S-adenosylmethionine:tRNA ribosyltransferase-isomerase